MFGSITALYKFEERSGCFGKRVYAASTLR